MKEKVEKKMDLEEFLKQAEKITSKTISMVAARLGRAGPFLDRDEIVQNVREGLIRDYYEGRINFDCKGWREYVRKRAIGYAQNPPTKESKRANKVVSMSKFNPRESGNPTGMDEIASRYGIEEPTDDEKRRERGSLIGDLRAAMKTLSSEERFVIIAHEVDKKSLAKIATILEEDREKRKLGVSREAIRNDLIKIKETLKSFLQDRGWSEIDLKLFD